MTEHPTAPRLVAGRYAPTAPPQRRGTPTLWRARDIVLRRKVIAEELRLPPAASAALLAEIRARQPGAASVLGIVQDGEDTFVITAGTTPGAAWFRSSTTWRGAAPAPAVTAVPVAAPPTLRIFRHAAGFTVLAPAGWAREERPNRVTFRSPGGSAILGVSWVRGRLDPVAELRARAAQFRSVDGYQELRLGRAGPGAAEWEYTAGGVRGWSRAVSGPERGFFLSLKAAEGSLTRPVLRRIADSDGGSPAAPRGLLVGPR